MAGLVVILSGLAVIAMLLIGNAVREARKIDRMREEYRASADRYFARELARHGAHLRLVGGSKKRGG